MSSGLDWSHGIRATWDATRCSRYVGAGRQFTGHFRRSHIWESRVTRGDIRPPLAQAASRNTDCRCAIVTAQRLGNELITDFRTDPVSAQSIVVR